MPNFIYKAINENGNTVSGKLEAESEEMVNSALVARGLIPSEVSEEKRVSSGINFMEIKERLTPVKLPELILFTKQFRTLIRAGVPMLHLLQVMVNQTENLKLKRIITSMEKDIREGSNLYSAFIKYPKIFSPLFCSMIHAGEVSGALPSVLDRLIYIIEHEHKVKSDIKSALQYPLFVLGFLCVAFFVILTFVIPRFSTIFINAGLVLPLPTKICMGMYQLLADYWYFIIGSVIVIGIGLTYYLRTENGKYIRDAFFLKFPLFGPMLIKAAMSRFASIFSILQSSGVAVLDSMKILSETIGNVAISREFDDVNERLEEGRGIAEPLKSAKYFTPIVINMVAIGEETGNLDEMLNEVSSHYDSELEYAMKKLSDSIGPILTIGLAAVVGFFALAIFLPMWDLTKMLK